jgi:hypothetical protein
MESNFSTKAAAKCGQLIDLNFGFLPKVKGSLGCINSSLSKYEPKKFQAVDYPKMKNCAFLDFEEEEPLETKSHFLRLCFEPTSF